MNRPTIRRNLRLVIASSKRSPINAGRLDIEPAQVALRIVFDGDMLFIPSAK